MKLKNLLALGTLLLVLFLGIGIATANENAAIESVELNAYEGLENIASNVETTSDDGYWDDDAVIEDTTEYSSYTPEEDERILDYDDQLITCRVKDSSGYLDDAYVFMEDENGNVYEAWWDDDDEEYWFECKLPAGKHEITVFLDYDYYNAEPLTYNVIVEKTYFTGTVTCKDYYGTTSGTLTMKATVKDSYDYREEGTVIFKVDGKTYSVKTKNGVATKTIRISKAGTYTYMATFKSGNYLDTGVGRGKLHVYSTSKKARTFKIKGYTVVVPVSKYKQFVNAKNSGNWFYLELKTNKYVKQKVGHYKNNLRTVKARVSILMSYGGKNGGQYAPPNKYYMCLITPYQNPGYDFCTPWLYGAKKSTTINKLNSAKTTKW